VEFINETKMLVGRARIPRTRSLMALKLCFQSPIVHTTVLFKKAAALAVGGYLPGERHAEDFSLWGRLVEQGEFIALPERLVRFRLHDQSVSQKNLEIQRALTRQIGIRHCQKFMRVNSAEAVRVNTLLLTAARDRAWRDWWWFLTRCVPRLRWLSIETIGWCTSQTGKRIFRC
jgi:hypothetical protein